MIESKLKAKNSNRGQILRIPAIFSFAVSCNIVFDFIRNHWKGLLEYMGSRFLEPPGETQIGSRNRRVREIAGKITLFD